MKTPKNYEKTMQYMLANPGMSYDKAAALING